MSLNRIKNKDRPLIITFTLSLLCMVLFAASFLLMPAANSVSLNEGKNGFLYAVGITFWIMLVASQVFMLIVSLKRRKDSEKGKTKKLPGVISFFSNKEAKMADLSAIVFIIAFIICVFATDSYLIYVFLFLAVLSFEAHCVLNGKNYIYIKELISGGNA